MAVSPIQDEVYGRDDFVRVLHNYVGIGHSDAVYAHAKFYQMASRMIGAPLVLPKDAAATKLDRNERSLAQRIASVERANPSLEVYLKEMEGIGEKLMGISINGNYTHHYDPGRIPIPIRAARSAYFGMKLFANEILLDKMKNWQSDPEVGRFNPIRDDDDFKDAQAMLIGYQKELSQLLAQSRQDFPPSEISDVERSFLQLPLTQKLSLLFGDLV